MYMFNVSVLLFAILLLNNYSDLVHCGKAWDVAKISNF